jgi:two-component system cell cycle sensor histidine kinase/response regulator CckA
MTDRQPKARPGRSTRQQRLYERNRAAVRIAVLNALLFVAGAAGAFVALRSPAGDIVAMIAAMVVIGLGMVSVTFIVFTAQSHERELPRDLSLGLDAGPLGLFMIDEAGDPTFLNETLVTWLGYEHDGTKPRRAIQRAVARRLDGKDAPEASANALGVRRSDGSLAKLHVALHAMDGDGLLGLAWEEPPLGIMPSAGSEELASGWVDLMEGAGMGLARIDAAGRVVTANRAFRRLLGGAGQVRPGRFVADFVAPEDRRVLIRSLADAGQGGDVSDAVEVRLIGEEERAVALYLASLKRTGEAAQGSMLHAVDATPRRALEAQFEQSQKLHAVGQLASGVAHDFNNILTAITGFCDLLLQRHPPGDPSFGEIMQIKQDAGRAAGLVRQLLMFSRRQRPRPRVMALSDAVGDLMHLLRRLLGEQIRLQVDHARDQGYVRTDQSQLEQVVTNLVLNARDAIPQGGVIRIATYAERLEEARNMVNGIAPRGQYCVLEVADQGPGIDPELAEKIFEPFFTTKEVGKGTGLGLATVYGVVEQNDGFIDVGEAEGGGCVFRILLPRLNRTEVAALRDVPPAAQPGEEEGASILLVEDEAAVRTFAASALRGRGHEVTDVDGPEAALEALAAATRRFDLLVTDVVMPGRSGPQLAAAIRAKEPDIAVIFISGYSEDAAGAEDIDSANFLAKPFGLGQLAAKVAEVLEQRSPGRPPS